MTERAQEEYRALRATIRERGTARVWVFVAGLAVWGALTVAMAALTSTPLAVLLPLILLAATFEAVLSLHVGVERIGRYIQVFYEEDGGWEHVAMAFGRPGGALTTDPLFSIPFFLAAVCNLGPALVAEPLRAAEVIVATGAHVLFVLRLVAARGGAQQQRAIDLERFRQLKKPQ